MHSGTLINGKYRIENLLGRGAFSEVYSAKKIPLEQLMALKILRKSENRWPPYVEETKAIISLEHPNIVKCHSIEESENQYVIAMEFFRGESLAALLSRKPLTNLQSITICREAAQGLHHAHVSSVLHHNISPRNILVHETADTYSVKVVDFGLAPVAAHSAASNMISFHSPEVLAGQNATIRSEIYSLGAVLYTCLTAAAPFEGVNEDPLKNPQLTSSAEVRKVLAKAMHKDASKRYETMPEFAAALEGLTKSVTQERAPGLQRQTFDVVFTAAAFILIVATLAVAIPALMSSSAPGDVTATEAKTESDLSPEQKRALANYRAAAESSAPPAVRVEMRLKGQSLSHDGWDEQTERIANEISEDLPLIVAEEHLDPLASKQLAHLLERAPGLDSKLFQGASQYARMHQDIDLLGTVLRSAAKHYHDDLHGFVSYLLKSKVVDEIAGISITQRSSKEPLNPAYACLDYMKKLIAAPDFSPEQRVAVLARLADITQDDLSRECMHAARAVTPKKVTPEAVLLGLHPAARGLFVADILLSGDGKLNLETLMPTNPENQEDFARPIVEKALELYDSERPKARALAETVYQLPFKRPASFRWMIAAALRAQAIEQVDHSSAKSAEAFRAIKKTLQENGDKSAPWYGERLTHTNLALAAALIRSGQYDEPLKLVSETEKLKACIASKDQPTDYLATAARYRCGALFHAGRYAECEKAVKAALKIWPHDQDLIGFRSSVAKAKSH